MIDRIHIISIARHLLRRDRGVPDKRLMHPVRDWMIGLSVASILFLCTAFVAGAIFLTQIKSIDEPVYVETVLITYKREDARTVLETYAARSEKFEVLRFDRRNAVQVIAPDDAGEENAPLADEGEDE